MPPKPKFSKEEIIDAALDIVSRDGVAALTARELGEKLGCSSSPIFTVFKSMDEVMQAIRDEAKRRYDKYVSRARDYYPSFKAIGHSHAALRQGAAEALSASVHDRKCAGAAF